MRFALNFVTYLITLLAVFCSGLNLAASADVKQSIVKRDSCASCPLEGQTGDPNCRLVNSSGNTDPATGCPTCGCQKCLDQQIYANTVKNYCSASPSDDCGGSAPICLIACQIDNRCTTLDFDADVAHAAKPCICPCQVCRGQPYQYTSDYTKAKPLTAAQARSCPNVLYPVQQVQSVC